MHSSLTYRTAIAHIDDLRRDADQRRGHRGAMYSRWTLRLFRGGHPRLRRVVARDVRCVRDGAAAASHASAS